MLPPELEEKARAVLEACRRAGLRVATAESCTGGLVGACLTALPGSSDVVDRGFITYTNDAKTELLDVPVELLQAYGAVSAEVARAMAQGALKHSRAQLAVAITGIAGPGGGTATKPVGLVFLATAREGQATVHERHVFSGDRAGVRRAAVEQALSMLASRA
jgi:nicotinamide-nucleotide amidase